MMLTCLKFQPPAALGKASWWLGQRQGVGLLEQSLLSPRAGEGVGVPRGHEELHRGFAAVQERSVSPCCPGTGNSTLVLHGDPECFCSGTAGWSHTGTVCLLSGEPCSQPCGCCTP